MISTMILSVRTFLYRYQTMKWISTSAAVLTALLLFTRPVQGQFVMKFDGNSCTGTGSTVVATTTYVESGFQLVFGGGSGYAYWCSGNAAYAGSNAIFNNSGGGLTTLSRVGGTAFALTSIDLANLFTPGVAGSVLFTGDLQGGGTVTQTESWNAAAGSPAFTTDLFGGAWNNLIDVKFSEPSAEPLFQVDNIVLNNVVLSVTPEPATMTLMAMGLVGIAGVGRRRRLAGAGEGRSRD
jgi:hypothetical protein